MPHEWTVHVDGPRPARYRYRVEGDPSRPETMRIFRNGKDMSDDEDGASICELDVLAELLRLAECAGASLLEQVRQTGADGERGKLGKEVV